MIVMGIILILLYSVPEMIDFLLILPAAMVVNSILFPYNSEFQKK